MNSQTSPEGGACPETAENSAQCPVEESAQAAVSREEEELVASCLVMIQAERRASTALFQRRFRLGYIAASRIMDILEARGFVDKVVGAMPREVNFAKVDEAVAALSDPAVRSAVEQTRNASEAAEVREMLDGPAAGPAEVPKASSPPITKASVRVMRSHDYCHFEVVLSTEETTRWDDGEERFAPLTTDTVDALRKQAARLVDKAVAQFKVAKRTAERLSKMEETWSYERARRLTEDERSPEDKAIIKFHEDAAFRRGFDYDYEDDFEDRED